jgi:hypothetical protein
MSKNTLIALGVGLLVIIVLAFVFLRGGGPIETTVYLTTDPDGGCFIEDDGKEAEIKVGENKQVAWIINHDNCTDKQAVVTVGNFRRTETPSLDNCRNATTGGTNGIWLFAQPEALQHRQSHSRIPLTTKGRADLSEGTYYYDICAGANAEKKSDPRLVIDY